jgi:hypothetical protein
MNTCSTTELRILESMLDIGDDMTFGKGVCGCGTSSEALILFISPQEAPEPLTQDEGVTDRGYNRVSWIKNIPALAAMESWLPRSRIIVHLGTSSLVWTGSQDSANSSVSGV